MPRRRIFASQNRCDHFRYCSRLIQAIKDSAPDAAGRGLPLAHACRRQSTSARPPCHRSPTGFLPAVESRLPCRPDPKAVTRGAAAWASRACRKPVSSSVICSWTSSVCEMINERACAKRHNAGRPTDLIPTCGSDGVVIASTSGLKSSPPSAPLRGVGQIADGIDLDHQLVAGFVRSGDQHHFVFDDKGQIERAEHQSQTPNEA